MTENGEKIRCRTPSQKRVGVSLRQGASIGSDDNDDVADDADVIVPTKTKRNSSCPARVPQLLAATAIRQKQRQ